MFKLAVTLVQRINYLIQLDKSYEYKDTMDTNSLKVIFQRHSKL